MTPDDLRLVLIGAARLTKKHQRVWNDVPFSRHEYQAATRRRLEMIPQELRPLCKNLKLCPGCAALLAQSSCEAHLCPKEGPVVGGPADSRGSSGAGVAERALPDDPAFLPVFFGGGLPSLGRRH